MKKQFFRLLALLILGNAKTQNTVTITNLPCPPAYTKVWMLKNLDVSTYSDGTPIPKVTDSHEWDALTTGAYCYYANDSTKYSTSYGKLYNWYAVAGIYNEASLNNVSLRKKLAPTGFHIPSDAEWKEMSNAFGGDKVSGGKMKETSTVHWKSPNWGATNSSNFTGRAGGFRRYGWNFWDVANLGYWWNSTEYQPYTAWGCSISFVAGDFFSSIYNKNNGMSVRCIKD